MGPQMRAEAGINILFIHWYIGLVRVSVRMG
jgi:hypothetical protein